MIVGRYLPLHHMRKILALVSLSILTTCSDGLSNSEIVQEHMRLKTVNDTDSFGELLADDLTVIFGDGVEMNKESVVSNHNFNIPYHPWNKIILMEEKNDSTVMIHALETNELNRIFKIDTIAYAHQFTLKESRISKIEIDIIPNAGYNYKLADSIYNTKLDELFNWMSLVYPEELEQLDGLDSTTSSIILRRAKEREDNSR